MRITPEPPQDAEYPCVVLAHDNWNDFGYLTYFFLGCYDDKKTLIFEGELKILQKDFAQTTLPPKFDQLSKGFYSLGQSIEFYKKLQQLSQPVSQRVLGALNDVVYNNELRTEFETVSGSATSLLRFSEAAKVYKEAPYLFSQNNPFPGKNYFDFAFSCKVPGAKKPHSIHFDFRPDKTLLNRIIALIGRNGTGKTQVLATFANAMSGLTQEKGEEFFPSRPSFSKVIAISYSIFDEFERPTRGRASSRTFSYEYCGIREEDSIPDVNAIRKRFTNALKRVNEIDRSENWEKVLKEIFASSVSIGDLFANQGVKIFSSLSSGQKILALIMTEVIANIAPESIILFDEPEIHLHPDVLSAVARSLHILLEEFDSYAIVATHSPILLQEIPSKYVRIFRREGDYPIVSSLGIESFGENLTTITDEVFETSETNNNYRLHLRKLSKQYSYEEIIEIFDNKLGFNAKSFLGAIYAEQKSTE